MGAPAKLAGFAVILLLAFGASFGLGRAVGPVGDDPAPATPVTTTGTEHGGHP